MWISKVSPEVRKWFAMSEHIIQITTELIKLHFCHSHCSTYRSRPTNVRNLFTGFWNLTSFSNALRYREILVESPSVATSCALVSSLISFYFALLIKTDERSVDYKKTLSISYGDAIEISKSVIIGLRNIQTEIRNQTSKNTEKGEWLILGVFRGLDRYKMYNQVCRGELWNACRWFQWHTDCI